MLFWHLLIKTSIHFSASTVTLMLNQTTQVDLCSQIISESLPPITPPLVHCFPFFAPLLVETDPWMLRALHKICSFEDALTQSSRHHSLASAKVTHILLLAQFSFQHLDSKDKVLKTQCDSWLKRSWANLLIGSIPSVFTVSQKSVNYYLKWSCNPSRVQPRLFIRSDFTAANVVQCHSNKLADHWGWKQ